MTKLNTFKIVAMGLATGKAALPVLTQIRVESGVAFSTNLDIEISAPVDLPDGEYNKRGEQLAAPVSRDELPGINIEGISDAPVYNAGALSESLALVESAISDEETRYYLNGVFFEFNGGMTVTACDGHRLMTYAALGQGAPEIEPFILPKAAVAAIVAVKGGAWTMRTTKHAVFFQEMAKGIRIVAKKIDGSFPEYRRIIPQGPFNQYIEGNASECLTPVKKCDTYGPKSSGTRTMRVSGGALSVSPKELAALEMSWPVDVIRNDPESSIDIGFNARYLRDALEAVSGTKNKEQNFLLSLTDSASPVKITYPGIHGLTGVVMPMRIQTIVKEH